MRKFSIGLTASLFLLACGARTPMDCPAGEVGCECANGFCEPSSATGAGGQVGVPGAGGDSLSQAGSAGRIGLPAITGGVVGFAGMGSGGIVGSGGVVFTGGVFGTGGTVAFPATGGRIGTGGNYVVGTAGIYGRGGVPGFGGSSGLGGQTPITTGGRTGRGGSGPFGTGGLGRGGMSGYVDNTVTFVNGHAEGPMTGYGWVALGAQDLVSAPTCADGSAVTSTSQCPAYAWPASAGLCLSGTIPAVLGANYDDNWGILMSAAVSDPPGGTLGRSYQAILFNVSGSPQSSLRGAVHRKGDAEDVNYCATIKPGASVMLTSFNTACWDGSGTQLTLADVPNLDWIGIQVVSGTAAIPVSNLCLTSLVFK